MLCHTIANHAPFIRATVNYCIIASTGEPIQKYNRAAQFDQPYIAMHGLTALLVADFALTFTIEVRRIWQQPFTGATVVYLLARYSMLVERALLVSLVLVYYSSDEVCHSPTLIRSALR